MDTFHLEETDSMTLYIVLSRLREEQDPSLQFDFCCRAGICGSCAMLINGKPDLACHTKTKDLPAEITLHAPSGLQTHRGPVGGYRHLVSRHE